MQVWMSPHAQIKVMQTRGCLVAVVQTQDADSCVSTLIFVTPEELPSPTPFVALALSGVRRKCKTPASRLVFISGLSAEGYSKGLTPVRVAAPCFPSLSQIPLAAC